METSLCLGQCEKFLLVYLGFPGAHIHICEALELEVQEYDEVVDDPSVLEESPRSDQLIPCIMTITIKKKRVGYCHR